MPISLPSVRRVVAIASGKGGVGKTSVTVYLALALHQAGYRAGIFDADIYGPNISVAFGAQGKRDANPWLPIARAERQPNIPPLQRFGITVMSLGLLLPEGRSARPAPEYVGALALQTLQDTIWGELDYLLIDFPPGTGEPQRTLLTSLPLDGVLLITTPSTPAMADTERAADFVAREGQRVIGVVENLGHMTCPRCGERIALFDSAIANSQVLSGFPLIASIPWSAHLTGKRLTDGFDVGDEAILADAAAWLAATLPVGEGGGSRE